jgi:hypothetical protein
MAAQLGASPKAARAAGAAESGVSLAGGPMNTRTKASMNASCRTASGSAITIAVSSAASLGSVMGCASRSVALKYRPSAGPRV